MGERLVRNQKVVSSILITSTMFICSCARLRWCIVIECALRRKRPGNGGSAFEYPLESDTDQCSQHGSDQIDPRRAEVTAHQVGCE